MIDVVSKQHPISKRERPQETDFDEGRRVVRVVPANETLRKYLKHPKSGAFLAEGSSEWPNDQYTRRRIKAGDVTVEEAAAAPQQEQQKVIEASGAKASRGRADKEATPTETSAAVDPNKTTAPKT
jgi:hypothetical protein